MVTSSFLLKCLLNAVNLLSRQDFYFRKNLLVLVIDIRWEVTDLPDSMQLCFHDSTCVIEKNMFHSHLDLPNRIVDADAFHDGRGV